MKLSKFTIRNYKGIKELTLNIENISIIIGPNNCCKSTVLQALKQFGSADKKLDLKYYNNHDASKPISFHATFIDVSDEEATLHGLRASMHEETKCFIVRAVYNYGEDVKRISKTSGEPTHDLEEEGWEGKMGGGNNASHFVNIFPEVIYIPAVKNASDEIKNTSDNIKTLTALYREVIHSLDEYTEAETKTRVLQDKINQHDDEKIKYFESEIQSFLTDITSTKINFKVNVQPLAEFVSTSVNPLFNYNGIETELDFQGNGVQRTFIVSILKGYRKYKSKYSIEAKEQALSRRQLIIAIEEPELYLHPQIARIFKDTLYSLADDNYFQVIATSHSPNFIDLSKPNRTLAKASLNEEKKVCIHQVDSDIYGLPDDEKSRFQALLKFNPHVNEAFFADQVILVEGDTEVVALRLIGEKLVQEGNLDLDTFNRTTVVNCSGKPTMYVVMNVLNNFGVKYTVIHDLDITEINAKGDRRTPAALKSVLTINYKLEYLANIRNNKRFVFQHTFEAEMPHDYEKGSSKSFSAYEYINPKSIDQMPIGLIDIVKSVFGITLDTSLDHSNKTLLTRYVKASWTELSQAIAEWQEPKAEEFVRRHWSG
ncbi:ATP-dependent nuclease [Paenibacillus periandrae]|uniref:ATP-dependent nuclease n=1 Tax=Paenibacillus periandrae TaxID=1761741 RepID=UPI001F0903A2|nr:AAA family ATPase [Paenibacillus periandrae]